jgi:hypothetical protein
MSWNIQTPGDYINGPLTVAASATITGDLTVRTNKLKVDATGVAIGATSAAYLLDVRGTDTTFGFFSGLTKAVRFVGSASTSKIEGVDNTNASYQPLSIGGSAIDFSLGGTTAMTLNATGLGVGVASPAYKLDVLGAGNSGIVGITTTGQVSSLRLRQTQNLGANTRNWEIRTNGLAYGNLEFACGASQQSDTYTASMIVDLAGNVGIGVQPSAGKGCLQLVSGINFPATPVASSDVNTLDDYKEGMWVPTLNAGTFSAASCRYTKIGNMVTIFFDVTVGTGGGSQITNLPFTANATSTVANGIYTNAQAYVAGTTAPVVIVGGSSNTLFFRTVGSGVAFSAMTFTAAANLTGSISYFA